MNKKKTEEIQKKEEGKISTVLAWRTFCHCKKKKQKWYVLVWQHANLIIGLHSITTKHISFIYCSINTHFTLASHHVALVRVYVSAILHFAIHRE